MAVERPARLRVPSPERRRYVVFLVAISESGFLATEMSLNGEPGLVVSVDGQVIAAIAHDVRDGRVNAIFIITNPEKLTRIMV